MGKQSSTRHDARKKKPWESIDLSDHEREMRPFLEEARRLMGPDVPETVVQIRAGTEWMLSKMRDRAAAVALAARAHRAVIPLLEGRIEQAAQQRKRWRPDVVRMHLAWKTPQGIANHLGISRTTVRKIQVESGLPPHRRK